MKEVYIIAISGGVDSVVLLDMIARKKPETGVEKPLYIVAHFDHGIRSDSSEDAKFVESLAKNYGMAFVTKRADLGEGASEESARTARYEFLFNEMKKHNAESVITAHHQDDVIETMIVNILRGTGPRGLIGFTRSSILRPFIDKSKQEILDYAVEHKLNWREDSTNLDTSYFRNYVRMKIVPKLSADQRQELIKIRENTVKLYTEIDDQTKKLLVQNLEKGQLVRARFVVLPYTVQKELTAVWLRINGLELDRKMIERAVLSIKTALPGKQINLNSKASLLINKKTVTLILE
ncbi:tRNA lysidine(34) synthetase TilS [Candidatus Saccharibacteria bacterium]|nr:tRNA lysidine(34) synthetase TilS [Candidatus Saccharibacteria bacterium]